MLRNCRSVFFLFSDCTKLCILNSFLLKNVWATATILQLPWHLRWLFLKSTDLYSRILSGFYRYGYRLRELHAFSLQLRLDTQNSVPLTSPRNCAMAKRTKSRNRMQITEFPARLGQHKRVPSEMQGMLAKFLFPKCFRNTGFCP